MLSGLDNCRRTKIPELTALAKVSLDLLPADLKISLIWLLRLEFMRQFIVKKNTLLYY